jgi:hypothetical protein
MQQITLLSFIVLLPVVPAYLLFKVLPSTGNVGGTFHGLEIKLGGAFAGYFAVIFLIFHFHDVWSPPAPAPLAVVWHLQGKVVDQSGKPIVPLDITDFSFSPPWFQVMPDGFFRLTIPTEPQQGTGPAWPMLVVSHKGYQPLHLPLSQLEQNPDAVASLGLTKDDDHKLIVMRNIVLPGEPPYNPKGQRPKKISGPSPKNGPVTEKKAFP